MTVMEPFVDVSYFHHGRWDEKQGAENVSQRSMCLRELNSRPPGSSETVSGSWSWCVAGSRGRMKEVAKITSSSWELLDDSFV